MKRFSTNRVIFHHSLSPDIGVATIRKWHLARGFNDVGYHYVIRADGEIEHGRDPMIVGAHAKGKNRDSIGVCLAGDFRTMRPTAEQFKSCGALYAKSCRKHGKDLKIEFHRTLKETNPCPGILLDRTAFGEHLTACLARTKGADVLKKYSPLITAKKAVTEGTTIGVSAAVLVQFLLKNVLDVEVSTDDTLKFSAALGTVAGAIRGAFNWWKNRKK